MNGRKIILKELVSWVIAWFKFPFVLIFLLSMISIAWFLAKVGFAEAKIGRFIERFL